MKYVKRFFAWPFMVATLFVTAMVGFFYGVYRYTIYGGRFEYGDMNDKCPWSDPAIRDFLTRMEHLPTPEEDQYTPLSEKLSSKYPFPIWQVRDLVKLLRSTLSEKETAKKAEEIIQYAAKHEVTIEESYRAFEITENLRA